MFCGLLLGEGVAHSRASHCHEKALSLVQTNIPAVNMASSMLAYSFPQLCRTLRSCWCMLALSNVWRKMVMGLSAVIMFLVMWKNSEQFCIIRNIQVLSVRRGRLGIYLAGWYRLMFLCLLLCIRLAASACTVISHVSKSSVCNSSPHFFLFTMIRLARPREPL